MVTPLKPLDHDLAVIETLETIGRDVYFAQAPDAAAAAVAARTGDDYLVLYPLDGGGRDGTALDPDELATLPYQVTCVGRSPEGVRWLAGEVERVLRAVSVPDRFVMRVEPRSSGAVRPDPDDDRVFIATPSWALHTSPA